MIGDDSPEYENEEHQEHAERGHIVHGSHEYEQLATQCRQEAHKLEYAKQAKCTQHGQSTSFLPHNLPHAATEVKTSVEGRKMRTTREI